MERTLESRLLHRGKRISFLRDEVELSDGRRTFREIVRHPGSVAIVPVLPDGRVVLVRQNRYPVGKTLLEIPAGTLELGEPLVACASRELREETGYEADELEPLLSCYMSPGYSSEVIHLFVATGLREVGGDPEPDEDISVERIELQEARRLVDENVIEDAKTIIGLHAISRD